MSMKVGLAKALLKPINTSAIVLLGVYTVLWGLWLIAPWWDVFTVAALYSQMAAIAPEWVWGMVALVCGSATMYGAIKPSYKTLSIGALVAGWHWTMVSVFYFSGDWHNTGGITAFIFAVYAAFVYLNIRVNKLGGDDDA